MEYHFLEIGITYLLGIAMPGPSITLIIKNGLIYSKKSAIYSCLGVMLGIGLQSGIVLTGLTIFSDTYLINILKFLSSFYLIYLSIKIFFKYKKNLYCNNFIVTIFNNLVRIYKKKIFLPKTYIIKESYILKIIKYSNFMEGLLLELLNPLALSFFISVLSIMTNYEEFWYIKFLYWLEILIIGLLWFCGVAIFSSSMKKTSNNFLSCIQPIETVAGIIFLFFGLRSLLEINIISNIMS
ncbi:MAG: hypothetical protein EKK61_00305 [Rickettsiales bacterium]|nr:MAG: hypothetical protein EKK61_00305 [Rickettsiales bacterium]